MLLIKNVLLEYFQFSFSYTIYNYNYIIFENFYDFLYKNCIINFFFLKLIIYLKERDVRNENRN